MKINSSKRYNKFNGDEFFGYRKVEKWEMPSKRVKIIVWVLVLLISLFLIYTSYGTFDWNLLVGGFAADIIIIAIVSIKLFKSSKYRKD